MAVLTSRSRTISSIDLESFPIETVPENETSEAKLLEASDSGCSPETNPSGDNGPQPSALEGIMAVLLPDVPDHRPLDESRTTKRFDESVLDVKESNKLEVVSTGMDVSDIQDESQHVLIDTAKYSVSKKDEKNNVDDGTEKKNEDKLGLKPPVTFLLSAISETGLVCLPSLLTAVLLQANNRLSSEHVSNTNFKHISMRLVVLVILYYNSWLVHLTAPVLSVSNLVSILVIVGEMILPNALHVSTWLMVSC